MRSRESKNLSLYKYTLPPHSLPVHCVAKCLLLSSQHSITHFAWIVAEPEPADLQWPVQKIRLDFNLLICYGITSLPILYDLAIII